MVDVPQVISLAALALVDNTKIAAAYLAKIGLAGMFVWGPGNFSTQVAADPAQAFSVAPNSDPTGASGVWFRLVVSPTNLGWFGLVSGAFTDAPTIAANSTAIIGFSTWARAQNALGFGLKITVDRGTYPWDMALTGHWTANINLMEIDGHGSTWQNVTTNPSWNFQWPVDWPGFLGNNSAPSGGKYLINSTTVGSLAFTTITPAEAANFVPGDYVMMTSGDLEYFGYPPNASNFEYPAIVSTTQNAAASPSSVTYTNANGLLALAFAAPPLGAVTLSATASFTAGVSKISMSSVAGLVTNMNVFDTTNTQQIGTIASINGLVIGLVNNASHASAGLTDSLVFTPQINGALVTMSGMTATGGTPPNGTLPISSVSGDGKTVTLQAAPGLGTLTFTANGTLAASGIAVLDRPIQCQHMSTYPDNPANPNPAGAARVWLLKNNGNSGSILWDWNVKHIYRGLKVLECPGQTNGQGYITMAGKHIEWHNCEFPGISPSVIGLCWLKGNKFTLNPFGSQPDKLIDICILEGNETPGNLQFSTGTNVLVATGNTIGGTFAPGAKFNICDGNKIGTLTPGSAVGVTRSVIITAGSVSKYPQIDHFGSGAQFTVGSGGITYANGTFTFPWNNIGVAAIPGMMLHFALAGGLYAGDLGSMMVTGIRGDATNLYVDTTCQSAAVPAFSTGIVFARHLQRFSANGVSGAAADEVRRASAAFAAGFQVPSDLEEQLIGVTSASGHSKSVGSPTFIDINVRQACLVASKTLTIAMVMFPTATPAGSAESLVLTIDLSTIGRRMVNRTTGAAVLLGADTLTFNAGTVTALPIGWFLDGNGRVSWALNYTPGVTVTAGQLPWVEMKMQFDPGMYFLVPTAQFDQTLLGTLIGLQGSLP